MARRSAKRRSRGRILLAVAGTVATGCAGTAGAVRDLPTCDPDDGGLRLPEGFCAIVVVDDVGAGRHLAVADNGDIYVALRGERGGEGGGVVGLRDTDGDGRADRRVHLGDAAGTGLSLHGGELFFAPDWGVLRYRIEGGELEPVGPPDTLVSGLPGPGTSHAAKSAVVHDGRLYVNVGAPSNACQDPQRTPGAAGQDPCPQLETRGGIWRFSATETDQTQAAASRFATGLRNTFALAVHPETGTLYGVQHGRDQLHSLWPDLFTQEQSAEKPAEELFAIHEGDDFGWPYCWYDPETGRKLLGPEYGGDGTEIDRCAEVEAPIVAFPAHWAPMSIAFNTGDQFPDRYRGGAFIAFHGSWNRAPLPQAGYNVVFLPFDGGEPVAPAGPAAEPAWSVFAEGFAGTEMDPRNADHRPTGLAFGPDGSLYIADDAGGRIWRVVHRP